MIARMKILLASPYELGRQPFSLAHPAAHLRADGHEVDLCDLTLGPMPWEAIGRYDLIGLSLGMHTATRIVMSLLPTLRARAKAAHIACYGLYGPANAALLKAAGVDSVLGAEFEGELTALAAHLAGRETPIARKVVYHVPDRRGLPPLARYAHVILPDGSRKTVGFVETTRGCKYLCRHCPVVPVYQWHFRAIPQDIVLADAEQQIARGAQHLSFGDPDFLNGPTHALKILAAVHARWPDVTFDATVKISHILRYQDLLPKFRSFGCLFLMSAAESFDDAVLAHLEKGHTGADIDRALQITRAAGIALTPTFVPFTPWTRLADYRTLLARVRDLALINSVTPIQLVIRLLVPERSALLDLPGFRALLRPYSPPELGYPWRNPDPRVDDLQLSAQAWVERAEQKGLSRFEAFAGLWDLTHAALREKAAPLDPAAAGPLSPHLSEPWYCCAEPTAAQLAAQAVGD